ncbi:MarR family transcriptional regulator [Exiguobacterium alkaliphilum]|uniref:MarR family transcriptional regulator n=1 Tax=Exiguobacterium alkaliphilum TaxID=1428684 RepID=A0ABT2KWY3_9BACL|nr:MarR family transcriptional regulator [Exiguobacterium alkaliphilum]MCT4795437.1 MarR family transcriptional regulator [Exiguobacterium alkaliphilum]
MKGERPLNETRKQQVIEMYRQIDELDLLFTKYFTDLNEFQLSYQQEQMLLLFKRQETWTTTEIATKMNISKSAVSQVLKVLEQREFVQKEKIRTTCVRVLSDSDRSAMHTRSKSMPSRNGSPKRCSLFLRTRR